MAKLIDIARIAQVSESAVSRALNDHPRIPVATRERIKKIAAELEFDFNSHAKSLATRRSDTIGVVVPNFGSEARRTYYLDLLISDIRSRLSGSGFDLLLSDSTADGHDLKRLVRQNKVDGLVLIIGDLPEDDRQALARAKVPVVVVNSKPLPLVGESLDDLPCFFTDNLAGGSLAAEHLIGRRCQQLICLADEVAGPEMLDRTLGFVTAARHHGLEPRVVSLTSDFESTARFVRENPGDFASGGVFCHTDVMACAVLQTLASQGVAVPGAVRVVGYDDIELGTYFTPRLTTIHQPREEIARRACDALLAMISNPGQPPVAHISVAPSLVVREST